MTLTFDDVFNMPHKVFVAQISAEEGRFTYFPAQMNKLWRPHQTMYPDPVMGLYPANGQNELARQFLQTDYEYFFLVNDDQLYPPVLLGQLLSHQKDLVVPLVTERASPFRPLVYDAPGSDGMYYHRYLRNGERGLHRCYASGGGGMLIHRRIFEAIPEPWWEQPPIFDANQKKWVTPSEDMAFCRKVNEAGFQIWCDFDMPVTHLATFGIRALRDNASGVWYTEITRGSGRFVIPAAAPASGIVTPERHIEVPHLKRSR